MDGGEVAGGLKRREAVAEVADAGKDEFLEEDVRLDLCGEE